VPIIVDGVAQIKIKKDEVSLHAAAERFLSFLVSDEAQRFFSTESWEYPVVAGAAAPPDLPPLMALKSPHVAFADLADLEGTMALLRRTGVLP